MSLREQVQQKRFTSVAAEAWVSVIVAGDRLAQQADEVFGRLGITGDQYNVLRILRGARPHGLARGDVTQRLMRRAPDTTRMLDRLERAGLIERSRDPADARRSMARITEDGVTLLDRIDPEIERLMRTATAALDEAELRELARLCDALIR
jgi:DNA-binding MarR family transcriptional regulator